MVLSVEVPQLALRVDGPQMGLGVDVPQLSVRIDGPQLGLGVDVPQLALRVDGPQCAAACSLPSTALDLNLYAAGPHCRPSAGVAGTWSLIPSADVLQLE